MYTGTMQVLGRKNYPGRAIPAGRLYPGMYTPYQTRLRSLSSPPGVGREQQEEKAKRSGSSVLFYSVGSWEPRYP